MRRVLTGPVALGLFATLCWAAVIAQTAKGSDVDSQMGARPLIEGDLSSFSGLSDKTFVADGDVNLRTSPPSGWFYRMGESVGVIKKGQKVLATDQKVVKTLFGEYQWLKVRAADATTGEFGESGWVYAGEKGQPPLFRPTAPVGSSHPPTEPAKEPRK